MKNLIDNHFENRRRERLGIEIIPAGKWPNSRYKKFNVLKNHFKMKKNYFSPEPLIKSELD